MFTQYNNLKKILTTYNAADYTDGEKAWWEPHKNATSNCEQVLEATAYKIPAVEPPTSHHEKLSKLDEPDMQETAGEAGTSS